MDSSDEDNVEICEGEAYSHYYAHVNHVMESWQKDDLLSLKEHVIALRKKVEGSFRLWVWEPEFLERPLVPILFEILTKYIDNDLEIVTESLKIIGLLASNGLGIPPDIVPRIQILGGLLEHSSHTIVKETLDAFGNIAMGNTYDRLRSFDFTLNFVLYIERFLTVQGNSLSIRQTTARLVENLCLGRPPPNLVAPLLRIAATYIRQHAEEDEEVLRGLVGAFAAISYEENKIKEVLETGITLDICNMLMDECPDSVLQPAFNTLTHIMRGTEQEIQTILEHGALRALQQYPLEDTVEALEVLAERNVQVIIDDQTLMERLLQHCLDPYTGDACTFLMGLCVFATDEQIKQLLNIPGMMPGLISGSFDSDLVDLNQAWKIIEKVLRIGRFRCIESCKHAGKFKDIVTQVMELHPLQRLLRCPDVRDRADFATMLVGLGCNPNAKVQGTDVSLAKYALTVSTRTGVRLNQLSVLILLMGPALFQRLCPMHGVWLPCDLWIVFQSFYFLQTKEITEIDLPSTALTQDVSTIEDLEEALKHIEYGLDEKDEHKKEHCFYSVDQ